MSLLKNTSDFSQVAQVIQVIEAEKPQSGYNSTLKNNGYANGYTQEQLDNNANNAADTTAQKPSINIQGMIENDHKKKELLEANNNNEQQQFKDISSLFPYQERVIKIFLKDSLDANYNLNKNAIITTQQQKDDTETEDPIMKISNDDDDNFEQAESGDILISCNSSIPLRLLMLKDNFIIADNKAFEIIIKFIAQFTDNTKGFYSLTKTFFKTVHNQLEYELKEGKDKTELQKIINKAIRNKNKFIYRTNIESTYGALCFEHMKHIFKDVIRVGGALFDLKNRRYFDNNKAFDTCFARNGQEFILNTELLYKKEKKELIPYYKVNTTISAYKALHEAETPHDIIRRCDAIVNNPFKEYGIHHEGNKTYFNTFIKPFVRRVNYENDMQGIDLFFSILFAQYIQSDLEALLNWLAQIAQEPFKKLGYALFLQGTQGTGKNVIIEKLPYYFLTGLRKDIDAEHELFSSYHKIINAEIFKGTTNPFMRDVFFMAISEVKDFTTSDMNALKEKINGSELTIKQHYHAPEFIPNRINFAFASNHKNGLRIEQNERRYLCIFSKFQSREDLIAGGYIDTETGKSDYWKAVFDWLHNQDGYAKLYDYFLKRDVSQVTKRDAPVTSSKHDAVIAGFDNYTHLLSEYDLPEVITACQARELIQRKDKTYTSVNRVASALNKLGYEKHPIMNNYDRQIRYNNKKYVIYVKNESIYKNETDKNTLCSLAETFFKAF